MVNIQKTKFGDAFDPTFNPNQAVRIDNRFMETIEDLARTGHYSLPLRTQPTPTLAAPTPPAPEYGAQP